MTFQESTSPRRQQVDPTSRPRRSHTTSESVLEQESERGRQMSSPKNPTWNRSNDDDHHDGGIESQEEREERGRDRSTSPLAFPLTRSRSSGFSGPISPSLVEGEDEEGSNEPRIPSLLLDQSESYHQTNPSSSSLSSSPPNHHNSEMGKGTFSTLDTLPRRLLRSSQTSVKGPFGAVIGERSRTSSTNSITPVATPSSTFSERTLIGATTSRDHNNNNKKHDDGDNEDVDESTGLLLGGKKGRSAGTFGDDDDANGGDDGQPKKVKGASPVDLTPKQRWSILAALWVGIFCQGLDATIVATLITPISSSFHSLNRGAWINTAYFLTLSCLSPFMAKMSDLVGRRKMAGLGIFIFATGCLLAGLAPNMELLLVSRLIQGIGGAGTGILGNIIVSDIVPLRKRGLIGGIGGVFWNLGSGIGGPLGGYIHEWFGWRWVFFPQAIVLYILSVVVFSLVKYRVPTQTDNWSQVARRVDYAGAVTLVVGIGSLVFGAGLNTNENLPFTHPLVLTLAVLTVVCLSLFVWIEARHASEPIFDLNILTSRNPFLMSFGGFFGAASTITVNLYYPMALQVIRSIPVAGSGARLIPFTIAGGVSGISTGAIIKFTGRYKFLVIFSSLLIIPTCVGLAGMDESTPDWLTWVLLVPQGAGISAYWTSSFLGCLATVTVEQIATATGALILCRTLGQVIGLALSSAVEGVVLDSELVKTIHGPNKTEIIRRVRETASAIHDLDPTNQLAAHNSYRTAIHAVFSCNVATAAICFVSALFVKEVELTYSLPKTKAQVEEGSEDSEAIQQVQAPLHLD